MMAKHRTNRNEGNWNKHSGAQKPKNQGPGRGPGATSQGYVKSKFKKK
jgi:hypothetical protein